MKTLYFLSISLLTILAAFATASPSRLFARDEAPIANDRTKTVLTIQRVLEGNGPKVVSATLKLEVKFDQEFFCSANVDGHTLQARGTIHSGPNQFLRAQINFTDTYGAATSSTQSNFLTRPGQPHTLTSLQGPNGSESVEAVVTILESR